MLRSKCWFSMEILLGPFHPYLEDALIEKVREHKKPDPFSPLLILVPSNSLRRRLKLLLVRERGLDLLDLHLLTFHQLSLRIFEDAYGTNTLELRDDLFFEEVLKRLIRTGQREGEGYSGLEEKAGGCMALWQTLRDLKDGMVDPLRALEAVREGYFGGEKTDRIASLFSLFHAFRSYCKERELWDYADLGVAVMGQASESEFLRHFKHVFFYGFYDLTQVQTDFFHLLARERPSTLFFPLFRTTPKHPAWEFSRRFYERHVTGLAHNEAGIRELASEPEKKPVRNPLPSLFRDEPGEGTNLFPADFRCEIFTCFGARDELLTAAKEILRLNAEDGIEFREMGVVARTLEPYVGWIQEVFSEHRIPAAIFAEEPLFKFPLAKAAWLLAEQPLKDYLRSSFIDLVSSPFFDARPYCPPGAAPRADLWDYLTRRLGITSGFEEWQRLERHSIKDRVVEPRENGDEGTVAFGGSADQLRILWQIYKTIHHDLSVLPSEGSWSQYAEAWKALLRKYLGIADQDGNPPPEAERTGAAISSLLDRLSGLDAVEPNIDLRRFLETFHHWLEHSSIPVSESDIEGVSVLDAMTARGIPFRALFILGMNEGLFPRTIREDAFLRDRDRRVLEADLGYKVSEKVAAFDEEKLLFALLVGASRERLYCLYQRADDNGRALTPSWYLSELRQALSRADPPVRVPETPIPRAVVEKRQVQPYNRMEALPPEELAIQWELDSLDPSALLEFFSPSATLYRRGRRAMKALEEPGGDVTEFDGYLGPLSDFNDRLYRYGVSPTSLERYAQCPFQFFAVSFLGLGRLERPEEIETPEASAMGRLCHSILRSVFEKLAENGYFTGKKESVNVGAVVEQAAEETFTRYELENPPGYPLVWEVLRETLIDLLKEVVARDLAELSSSGYRPESFETELEDYLPWEEPKNLKGLLLHGRMDRIDFQPQERKYRVVDYKLKTTAAASAVDNNLVLAAARGQRLQPPFYVLLAKRFAAGAGERGPAASVEASFYYVAPRWKEGPLVIRTFSDSAWEGDVGARLKQTLSFLVEGITNGRFVIQPGEHCRLCEVSEVCRKNHLPTRWRAEKDPVSQAHKNLKGIKLSHEQVERELPARRRTKA